MSRTPTSDWGDATPATPTSAGSASSGAGTPYFDIKINEVSPSEVSGMDADQIMNILHNLDVEGVTQAAEAHMSLASTLDGVANRLASNAHTLAGSWQGSAAQAAMNKFQQMHGQTAQLAAQAKQTGQVLHWTAGVLQKYKSLPTPHGESATRSDEETGAHIGDTLGGAGGAAIGDGIGALAGALGFGSGGQAKANAQAQKYLTALNQHLVQANNALPSTIGQHPGAWTGGTGLGPSHSSGGAGGAGDLASAPSGGPVSGVGAGTGSGGTGGPSGIGTFDPVGMPQGGSGPAGHLQGYTPPPGGGTSTLPPPGATPPPGGPPGSGPGLVPPSPPPNGGNVPDEENAPPPDEAVTEDVAVTDGGPEFSGINGAAESGAVSGVDSTVANANVGEIGAENASGMGAEGEGEGAGMFGGSGSGQQDKERRRQAWMNEDIEIWGVPKDSVESVIGSE